MTLTIEIDFLLERFAASDGHDGTPPEWPPAPARVFCALVAACEAGHGEALRWLERQGAPIIHGGETALSDPHPQWFVTNATVPNGGSARHPGRKNVMRARQRRWMKAPQVVYEWPHASPEPAVLAALDDAASRVAYIGRPTSPAVARVHDGPANVGKGLTNGLTTWLVGDRGFSGRRLRVPYPGYFDALVAAHASGSRVDPPVYERYRRLDDEATTVTTAPPAIPAWRHFLTFPLVTDAFVPGERALEVTDALRDALLARIRIDIAPLISGHGIDPPHVAFLALPFVGRQHADGHLLGVALAVPQAAAADGHREQQVAAAVRQLRESLDPNGSGLFAIRLTNVRGFRELRFERPAERTTRVPWGARPERWVGPERLWRTVLPAVLDRAPSRRLTEEQAVLCSVANAGLPEPLAVQVRREPFRTGDLSLRPSRTLRRPTDRIRPYRHVALRFPQPVTGPVAIGALRHFGLGLCAPEREETTGAD